MPTRFLEELNINQPHSEFDVIIIGGGAAGLFCAVGATKNGLNALVLEKGRKFGAKILISGGGRCNFTNLDVSADNFLCPNPHFVKSALSRYTPWDFIEMLSKHGLTYHEKTLGQLFCDQKSRAIVSMLLDEASAAELRLNQTISSIRAEGNEFIINSNGQYLKARQIVIATGGPSFPGLGASDFALNIAKQFELNYTPFNPALVPLTLSKKKCEKITVPLAGVSLFVSATTEGAPTFHENLLFTHRGLSGPVILQLSSYLKKEKPIVINVLPNFELSEWRTLKGTKATSLINSILVELLPKRFVETYILPSLIKEYVNLSGNLTLKIGNWRASDWDDIWSFLTTIKFYPNGDEGFAKAEVSSGGIHPDELSSQTMMTKKIENLYFIGETIDVTGWLGGYNFQWAWSSAHACSMALT